VSQSQTICEPLPANALNAALDKIIVFIGLPGSGKQAQGHLLSEHLALPLISVGPLIRGRSAYQPNSSIRHAKRISDVATNEEPVFSVLHNRITDSDCLYGFILDGYPRNVEQARLLGQWAMHRRHRVVAICIGVPFDYLIHRMVGKATCTECGKIMNPFLDLEKTAPVCDLYCQSCGGGFTKANATYIETDRRLRTFFTSSFTPLAKYYQTRNSIIEIDGRGRDEDVFRRLLPRLMTSLLIDTGDG
jgi:adenylate kinase